VGHRVLAWFPGQQRPPKAPTTRPREARGRAKRSWLRGHPVNAGQAAVRNRDIGGADPMCGDLAATRHARDARIRRGVGRRPGDVFEVAAGPSQQEDCDRARRTRYAGARHNRPDVEVGEGARRADDADERRCRSSLERCRDDGLARADGSEQGAGAVGTVDDRGIGGDPARCGAHVAKQLGAIPFKHTQRHQRAGKDRHRRRRRIDDVETRHDRWRRRRRRQGGIAGRKGRDDGAGDEPGQTPGSHDPGDLNRD